MQKKSDLKKPKKPYKAPKLTVYGSVNKLTGAKAQGGNRDGAGSKKT